MIPRKILLGIKGVVLFLLGIGTNAYASTSSITTPFLVQIVVRSSCTIATNTLNFGNYSGAAVNVTTSLYVTCTNSTPYKVGLNAGTGSGATVTTRKMTSGRNTLNYTLYQDVARTIVWGNTQGTDTVAGTGSGVQQTLIVYGSIPGTQGAATGNYADTITATIYF